MELITKSKEYQYLVRRSIPYALGWQANIGNKDMLSARREINLQDRLEFDQGYDDCIANTEALNSQGFN
jgi:hypothetical protein